MFYVDLIHKIFSICGRPPVLYLEIQRSLKFDFFLIYLSSVRQESAERVASYARINLAVM